MPDLQPVSVTRLYRLVARQLAEKIDSGIFPPGTRLAAERELAVSLGVSRTTIREALIALEIEQYVEIRVGAGVFVSRRLPGSQSRHNSATAWVAGGAAEPPPESAAQDITPFELITMHLLVEPESAARAAKYGTEEQHAAIRLMNQNIGHSLSPIQQNQQFHVTIAQASGNAALLSTVRHLWGLRGNSAIYNKLEGHFSPGKIWQLAEAEHEEVAVAIMRRDGRAARRAMRTHFLAIRKRLHDDFKENPLFRDLVSHA